MINILFNTLAELKSSINDRLPEKIDLRSPGRKLADKAIELAYGENIDDDISSFSKGLPTVEYWEALNRAVPRRPFWSRAYKSGASDDIFIGTVVRESGIDPDFPHNRGKKWSDGQMGYLEDSELWQRVKVNKKNIKDGDIIVYSMFPCALRGHICMHVDGKIVEAGHKNFYPKVVDKLEERLSRIGKPKIRVYRARTNK